MGLQNNLAVYTVYIIYIFLSWYYILNSLMKICVILIRMCLPFCNNKNTFNLPDLGYEVIKINSQATVAQGLFNGGTQRAEGLVSEGMAPVQTARSRWHPSRERCDHSLSWRPRPCGFWPQCKANKGNSGTEHWVREAGRVGLGRESKQSEVIFPNLSLASDIGGIYWSFRKINLTRNLLRKN